MLWWYWWLSGLRYYATQFVWPANVRCDDCFIVILFYNIFGGVQSRFGTKWIYTFNIYLLCPTMTTRRLAFVHRLCACIVPSCNVLICICSIESFLMICPPSLRRARFWCMPILNIKTTQKSYVPICISLENNWVHGGHMPAGICCANGAMPPLCPPLTPIGGSPPWPPRPMMFANGVCVLRPPVVAKFAHPPRPRPPRLSPPLHCL